MVLPYPNSVQVLVIEQSNGHAPWSSSLTCHLVTVMVMFMPLSHATWSWSLSCHLVMVMVMFMSLGHGHGNVHVTWSCHLVIVKVNVYLIRGHDSLPTLIPFTNLQYISLFTNISILPTIRDTWQPPIKWNVSEFPPGRGECWNTEPDVSGVREGA